MGTLDERAATDRAVRGELAVARALLDGLPVAGPLLPPEPPRARGCRTGPRTSTCAELVGVLEHARVRVGRLLALLQDRPAAAGAVLR